MKLEIVVQWPIAITVRRIVCSMPAFFDGVIATQPEGNK